MPHSPALSRAHVYRRLAPYLPRLPAPLRAWLAAHAPVASVRRVCEIARTMDEHSRAIFWAKKAALEKGEHEAVQSVGEGRDMLSILCASSLLCADLV